MSPTEVVVLLVVAGVLAGMVGTAGGITSLVSYPALLAAGLSPLVANVANLVALVACWPASALVSRPELIGTAPWLRRSLPVAAAGGVAGSVLLLVTPPGIFNRVVPFLVAGGSLALLVQPRLAARREQQHSDRGVLVLALVGALSVYGGYFGAGSGVMVLALVLVLFESRMPQANALKNMLIGAAAVPSAAVFVLAGPVSWLAVAPLGAGLFVGSLLGPGVARRVPAAAVRWGAAALGLTLALDLWVRGR
jgi:uncharacterized membrane protein YfcA